MKNIEIKASTDDLQRIESTLQEQNARFIGEDHQIDTYFRVDHGRMKLREGTIERSLIWYDRPESKDLKESEILLQALEGDVHSLKCMLHKVLGTDVVVDKRRKIYFIGRTKFHIDRVRQLGSFVEIEVIDRTDERSVEEMEAMCKEYIDMLGLQRDQFIDQSYSDMIRKQMNS